MPLGLRLARRRSVVAVLTAVAVVLAGVTVGAPPAGAVSTWSGRDPYHDYGPGACANDEVYLASTKTYVYDQSTFVGTGYLVYSPTCQTNWGEFFYASPAAWNTHEVEPSTWEEGKDGTNQYSPDLNAYGPVYTLMVDGRGPACAGAQLYEYPSHHWVTWYTFGCV